MENLILLRNNLVSVPTGKKTKSVLSTSLLGTLVSNLAYYGYVPSNDVFQRLLSLSVESAKTWWAELEPHLKKVTGEDKNMAAYMVYKNFPQEVLEKSAAEYWIAQILMYWGMPNELFTQPEVSRNKMFEDVKLKTLHIATDASLQTILNTLANKASAWTTEEESFVEYLSLKMGLDITVESLKFKENMVNIAAKFITAGKTIKVSSAMDVLRLAVALSNGDITLATNSKFVPFKRQERRYFLNLLNNSSNLEEDLARDPNRWKKFLHNLHVGDYASKYKKVAAAQDKLYKDEVKSFNAKVEHAILTHNSATALSLLEERPGVFMRRLYEVTNKFGQVAVTSFKTIVDKLTVIQLLKLKSYLTTINDRKWLTITPKGNWAKLQIIQNKKSLPANLQKQLVNAINTGLKRKLRGCNLYTTEDTRKIKIPNNKQELAEYGQGTVFDIPDNVNFIRTASYWECKRGHNVWFDNGWNLFDKDWKSIAVCCWNQPSFPVMRGNGYFWNRKITSNAKTAAIFSGDPTNSKTADGRACQMIDLYLDNLKKQNVRYAVWNILCYSRIKFNEAGDVFASLQWGEEAQSGKLFEPSRAQISFPLKGDAYTKYICYLDVEKRQIVYMDAGLKANTNSAASNSTLLQTVMPAFQEYLDTQPSLYDLFSLAKPRKNAIPVLYSDKEHEIKGGMAYVFRPENPENSFDKFDINQTLWL